MMKDVERVMKPCPFCGGKAVMNVDQKGFNAKKFLPGCADRHCLGRNKTKYFYSVLRAVSEWNTRKDGDGDG